MTQIQKNILLLARFFSELFHPLYFPFIAFAILVNYSYIRLLPILQMLSLLFFVFSFTTLIPNVGIYFYRRVKKIKKHQLNRRVYRYIPYTITIISYLVLLYFLITIKMPRSFIGIFVSALALQIVCLLLTPLIKLSIHTAGAGAMIGAIFIFSFLFHFNAVNWLIVATLVTGIVATSRLIMRQHSLEQIFWSIIVGIACGFFGIAWT